MSLKEDKNKEALILWELLFYCEMYAQFHNRSNEDRAYFLKSKIFIYKNKPFVFTKIRKILRSNDIEKYVVAVHNSLFEIKL
jgi:hypothetical protein